MMRLGASMICVGLVGLIVFGCGHREQSRREQLIEQVIEEHQRDAS